MRYGITPQDLYDVWENRKSGNNAVTFVRMDGAYYTFAGDAGYAMYHMGDKFNDSNLTVEYRDFFSGPEADRKSSSVIAFATFHGEEIARDTVWTLVELGYVVQVYKMD